MRIIRARYRNGNEFLRHYQPSFDGGGIFFPTREALDEGQRVVVEVRLPGMPQRVLLRGTVAWRRAGRHSTKLRAGLGIEFHQGDAARRDFLLEVARGDVPKEIQARRHRRLPVDLSVEWRMPNERASHTGEIEDISVGGCFIRSEGSPAPGGDIFLHVSPPGSVQPLEIAARVAWMRPTED